MNSEHSDNASIKSEMLKPKLLFSIQRLISGDRIHELFDPQEIKKIPFKTDGIVLMPLQMHYKLGNVSKSTYIISNLKEN
jgi:hypothetical protein